MFTILLQILFAGIAVAIVTAIRVSVKAVPIRIPVRTREPERPAFERQNHIELKR